MRFLVVARPQFQIPPELLPQMIEGALEWHERYKEQLQEFGTFPGGGGFGIVEAQDSTRLNQLMLEMPFSPFAHHDVYPIVPGDTGLRQLRERAGDLVASG